MFARGVTDAWFPVEEATTLVAVTPFTTVVMVGATGAAATVSTLGVHATALPAAFVSVQLSVTDPPAPEVTVKTMLSLIVEDVIVPPFIDQVCVMPVTFGTKALWPAAPVMKPVLPEVMVCALGIALIDCVFCPAPLDAFAAFFSTTERSTLSLVLPVEVYVMLLTPPAVTPAVPPDDVMDALVTVQT